MPDRFGSITTTSDYEVNVIFSLDLQKLSISPGETKIFVTGDIIFITASNGQQAVKMQRGTIHDQSNNQLHIVILFPGIDRQRPTNPPLSG